MYVSSFITPTHATPLDDYILMPDPSYKFEVVGNFSKKGLFTVYVVNMTSQTWLTTAESNRPTWVHWLLVCVPEIRNKYDKTALLYINGGSNTDNIPNSLDGVTESVCLMSQSITAELQQIPNEPLIMGNETYTRTEDAIIAYTWSAFFNDTSMVYWPLHLPMTKAAVRALDTIQSLPMVIKDFPPVETFIVAGASKRGWTTWLTGAVDLRVIAIVPIVIDVLNISANINHQWEAYGAWSFALEDYVKMGVTHYLNKPQMTLLMDIEDPITYLDRYERMPKFVICATGDEFFLPDDPQFFWSQLKGEKYLRMVQNSEHSMAGHAADLASNIQTFAHAVKTGVKMPEFNWNIDNITGAITVTTYDKPIVARMWHARNLRHRDFRLIVCADASNISCINPILWNYLDLVPSSVAPDGLITYIAIKEQPVTGWGGHYVEMHYDLFETERDNIKFTTEVSILPTTLPFPSCGQHC
jgi:PhoPQ-activated pathogenicity-related protein